MEIVASLSQGRTVAAQCGLFTHKSVPVILEPPCISLSLKFYCQAGSGLFSAWNFSAKYGLNYLHPQIFVSNVE